RATARRGSPRAARSPRARDRRKPTTRLARRRRAGRPRSPRAPPPRAAARHDASTTKHRQRRERERESPYQQRWAAICRADGAGPRLGFRRQTVVARDASRTVAPPETVSVQPAPMPATIGPPIAVPSGAAMMSAALRAASTLGRLAGVVIDWKSAYVIGTKGP